MSEQKSPNSSADQWDVAVREGEIRLKTGRIGFIRINATAPVIGGNATWGATEADLELQLGIDEVESGNGLLDRSARSLVGKGSDGVLTFRGTGAVSGDTAQFVGHATSGDVEVEVTVEGTLEAGSEDSSQLRVDGTATFNDIHIPPPGLTSIKSIDIEVTGVVNLVRKSS